MAHYFTREEATRTLPLVRQIVGDILELGQELRILLRNQADTHTFADEIERIQAQLQLLFQELHELGCSYKDWNFTIGLVDFPAIINGEEVLLCWRSDETEVMFYHGISDGFAGRKLLE